MNERTSEGEDERMGKVLGTFGLKLAGEVTCAVRESRES